MKRSFRWIMACVLLSCVIFTGCTGKENPDTPPDTSQTPEQQGFAPSQITLIENGGSAYTIVYADESGADYRSIALDVQRQIEKYTGVKLPMSRDGSSGAPSENCILVGPTSFAQSTAVCGGMRAHDYTVRTDGVHLVFGVIGEKAANNALDVLIDAIKGYDKNGEAPLVLSLNESYTYTDYRLRSFTVNGVPLEKFSIVYGKDDAAEAALDVQQQIFDAYGSLLPIYMDWEKDPEGPEIIIGETKRPAAKAVDAPADALEYAWSVSEGNLILKSAGLHSLKRAALQMASHFAALGKDIALEDGHTSSANLHRPPVKDATLAEGADIRVMSSNVLADLYVTDREALPYVTERSEMYFAALDYYQPIIVGVQEFDASWFREWNNYSHKDQYEIVTASNENIKGEKYLTAIIYRSDLLEMDAGDIVHYTKYNNYRGRVMNWGVFRVKATGERFIFLNTHWDVDAHDADGNVTQLGYRAEQGQEVTEMVLKLQQEYGLPVICTGDWNLWEKDAIMVGMLKKTDMVNARQVLTPGYGRYIDMILTSKDVTVLSWKELAYNKKPDLGSDHAWLISDLKLSE